MPYTPVPHTVFFYTTDTPHKWSSGANIHKMNKRGEYISSLEEAETLAREAQVGLPGQESYVKVGWGSMVEFDFRYTPQE